MLSLITLAFIILFSLAVLNAVEAALFSLPLSKARALEAEKKIGAKSLIFLKEKISQPITALVVLVNLVGYGGSILVGVLGTQVLESKILGLFSAVLIFLIILFSEIVPKNFGARFAQPIALASAPCLKFFIKIFYPPIWLINKVLPIRKMTKVLPFDISEEEIKFLTIAGARAGIIEEDEAKMIQSAFRLNDVTAKDIMTPRSLVFWLDGNKTLGEKKDKIKKSFHSRILICDGELDKILGIAKKNDLLQALIDGKENVLIKELAQQALTIPDTRVADDLLRDFQKTQSHFAVVIDEYGEVEGAVTREDILQELVGELISEKDIAPELIKRISKNEILVHGQTKLSYINQFFNINLKGALTLNGFLLKKFEKFPKIGESFETDGIKITVEEATEKGVEKVKIIKT